MGDIQKTKTGKIASKKYKGELGGVSDAKKTQLFPQKVILMQYRPKIQEYWPSCGKKGHNGGGGGGGGPRVLYFLDAIFLVLVFWMSP